MSSTKSEKDPVKKPFQRLPVNVTPIHYNLFLKPDLQAFLFDGDVTIRLKINESTDQIILHSLDLEIISCILRLENGNNQKPKVDVSVEDETLTLNFDQAVLPGSAELYIEFKGELNDKMKGFYRSKHANINGEECYCAVTQFATTEARRSFPCWDEPAIKAVFELTVIAPKDMVALFNMPVVSEALQGNEKVVKFAPSPKMSSYLVAVVVGDFAYVEDTSADGVLVRVYTPPAVKEQGRFALHVATKVLPYYKEYFQIAYPLPKMDLVAVGDMTFGAMENWGLITYRQSALLVDSESTSAVHKQRVAIIIGHEIAHQWFGNLVTMEWWTHLWLNEGYASFVQDLCVDHLFPDYDIWTQFVTNTLFRALELDYFESSHPIEVPVNHPSEIYEIFDDISYKKGASVIRMLHHYLGDSDFRKGMNLYLTRHQYGNTFTEDLWAALVEASDKPVKDVMSTWTKQKGFPVIKVTNSTQVGNFRHLTLTQEKFCGSESDTNNNSLWKVPLTFSTKRHPKDIVHSCIFDKKTMVCQVPCAAGDWVKVNPATVGVYRTWYSEDLLDELIPAIQNKTLPPLDRLGIVDDLFALVKSGKCHTAQVLKVISAMTEEDNYTVWYSVNCFLSSLRIIVSYTQHMEAFNNFVRQLFKPLSQSIGWEANPSESHPEKLLRSLVLGTMGLVGDDGTITEARLRFDDHLHKRKAIPADLRSAVYRTVASVGNEETYNAMIKLYKEESLQEEKERILNSLGAFKDPKLLDKVLQFSMSDEVRLQDKALLVISVAQGKEGRDLVWDFIQTYMIILNNLYEGGFLLGRTLKSSLGNFATNEMANKMERFFKENQVAGLQRSISQALEAVRINAAWLNRDRESISQFLDSYNQ